MTDLAPLFGLRLRTPRLELRLGTSDDVRALGQLAQLGIHPPDEMPFAVAWSDGIADPGFEEEFAAYHAEGLASWKPEAWRLDLLTWEHGVLVGAQTLRGERFAAERVVDTGSWLGQAAQGRGIGTEMRAAVLELAFRGLGASAATSGWLEENRSSARISEKLGYHSTGQRGQPARRARRPPRRPARVGRLALADSGRDHRARADAPAVRRGLQPSERSAAPSD